MYIVGRTFEREECTLALLYLNVFSVFVSQSQ